MKKLLKGIRNGYDNVLNSTKLGYYLRKTVSTKNTYLLFIIFASLVLLGTYVSYAIFTVAEQKDKTFKIIAGNLTSSITSEDLDSTNSIVVENNKIKMLDITITNTNPIDATYNLEYSVSNNITNTNVSTNKSNIIKLDNENNQDILVKYVETSKTKPNEKGQFIVSSSKEEDNSKTIRIMINNYSSSPKKITFKSKVGLTTAELHNDSDTGIVNQEFSYTYNKNYVSDITSLGYSDINEVIYDVDFLQDELSKGQGDSTEDLQVKISKNKIYMDKSENLKNQEVDFSYRTDYATGKSDYGFQAYAPQSSNSAQSVYGNDLTPRLSTYFNYSQSDNKFEMKPINADWQFVSNHRLWGQPKQTTNDLIDIYVPVYVNYYKCGGINCSWNTNRNTYQSENFAGMDQITLKLSIYDKVAFKNDIERLKKKLYTYDPYYYNIPAYIQKVDNYVINLYNKREVTQKQLDDAITDLEKGPSMYYADYSAVDELINQYEALDSSLYTEESYNAVTTAVNQVVRNLAPSEQSTVDGYANAIRTALENLEKK